MEILGRVVSAYGTATGQQAPFPQGRFEVGGEEIYRSDGALYNPITYRLDDRSILDDQSLQVGAGAESGTGRLFRWDDRGLIFVTTASTLLGNFFVVDHAPGL